MISNVSNYGTIAAVDYLHCLGMRHAKGKQLEYISNDRFMYLVGKHVVTYDPETTENRFTLKRNKTIEIQAFCISPNMKYIALAEKMAEGLQVNVYTGSTGTKVRCIEFMYLTKLPIVSMCFSRDNKYIVTVTSVPDVFVYYWEVDKSRLIGMIDVPYEISKASISQCNYMSLCTTGPSSLRMWRLVDTHLIETDPICISKKRDVLFGMRFTSHCWYDDEKVAACTDGGDVILVENAEVTKIFRSLHGEGCGLASILHITRGLVVGGDGGIISILARTTEGSSSSSDFTPLKHFVSSHASCVIDLSVSPKEETLAIVHQDNIITTCSLESIETGDRERTDAVPLPIGFHSEIVTSVDVCTQKSFVVTASSDCTIRVWNFIRRKMEFIKTFEEEVLSLALHPTGLRILCGFKNSLRMFNMLADDLHFCAEFPIKSSHVVRFSNGGQYFAAVLSHRIVVFDTYNFTSVTQLFGHIMLVKSISWSSDDKFLTSADLNGVSYTWDVAKGEKMDSYISQKGINYTSVCHHTHSVVIYGVNRTDQGVREEGEVTVSCVIGDGIPIIVRPGVITSRQVPHRKYQTSEIALSCVSHTLFVGLPNGHLYLYHYPLWSNASPYQMFEVHDGEILFVILSKDERYLFTIGNDQSLFMFEVEALCEGRNVSKDPFNYSLFEDVCYMLHSSVSEKKKDITCLQEELYGLRAEKERDEKKLVNLHEDELRQLELNYRTQVERLRSELELANQNIVDIEKAMVDNSHTVEVMHLKAAEEIEALYTKRTEEANYKYNQLRMECDDMIVRYENKLFKLQKDHAAERLKYKESAKEVERRLTTEIESLRHKLGRDSEVHDAMIDQTIIDYEEMLEGMSNRHTEVIQKKDKELVTAINLSSTGERDADKLKRERKHLLDQLHARDGNIAELEVLADRRKRENEAQNKEMGLRFESISMAEKRIQQLKKQTTELEKLRSVLTYKFNELKKEVLPKEKQIEGMTQRVEEMDEELQKITSERDNIRLDLKHHDEKLRTVQSEVAAQRKEILNSQRVIDTILLDLTTCINESIDPKNLTYAVKDILNRYDSKSGRNAAVVKESHVAEFERQRTYTEAQLTNIKRQTLQNEQNLRLENQRNTAENATLVKEINDLRQSKKMLNNKCLLLESQLKDARHALQRAAFPTEGQSISSSPIGIVSADPSTVRRPQQPINTTGNSVKSQGVDYGKLSPLHKGKLIRGPIRALKDIATLDSNNVTRIINQIERNNSEMDRQQDEIIRLRKYVTHFLGVADADPSPYSAEDRRLHEEIREVIKKG